ncbi:hypothetical protein EDB84DRAFT_1438932 [Lactarius hengduanensis]|nr:hypothetical protein EDB84DRAFT_1438932 [Lactarius hengduanensis]
MWVGRAVGATCGGSAVAGSWCAVLGRGGGESAGGVGSAGGGVVRAVSRWRDVGGPGCWGNVWRIGSGRVLVSGVLRVMLGQYDGSVVAGCCVPCWGAWWWVGGRGLACHVGAARRVWRWPGVASHVGGGMLGQERVEVTSVHEGEAMACDVRTVVLRAMRGGVLGRGRVEVASVHEGATMACDVQFRGVASHAGVHVRAGTMEVASVHEGAAIACDVQGLSPILTRGQDAADDALGFVPQDPATAATPRYANTVRKTRNRQLTPMACRPATPPQHRTQDSDHQPTTTLSQHGTQDPADPPRPLNDAARKSPPPPTHHVVTRHVAQDPTDPPRPLNDAARKTPPPPTRHVVQDPADPPRPLNDAARKSPPPPTHHVVTRHVAQDPTDPPRPLNDAARKTPLPLTRHVAQDLADPPHQPTTPPQHDGRTPPRSHDGARTTPRPCDDHPIAAANTATQSCRTAAVLL